MIDTFSEHQKQFQKALSNRHRDHGLKPSWKKLTFDQRQLIEKYELQNITHTNSKWQWYEALSTDPELVKDLGYTLVYRPMGTMELNYLLENGQLPETQPYQAIIEGIRGRYYANKYLIGQKRTDTNPNTIVEFCVPKDLIETLKKIQIKCEDGALSMGLGNKAGKGLHLFNQSLKNDSNCFFRVVKIRR